MSAKPLPDTLSSFRVHVMAVDRVEKKLREVTSALDAAGLKYAVIGGNAVAAWVGRADPAATRATRDVDLLVRRDDLDRISDAMHSLGYKRHDLRRLILFTHRDDPGKREGIHLVWAEELVRPSYPEPAPSVDEVVRDPEGFLVLDLPALVRMKLTSYRDIDRVHIADLVHVGLIDDHVHERLSPLLQGRLQQIIDADDDELA